jgi:hypothetical protein
MTGLPKRIHGLFFKLRSQFILGRISIFLFFIGPSARDIIAKLIAGYAEREFLPRPRHIDLPVGIFCLEHQASKKSRVIR